MASGRSRRILRRSAVVLVVAVAGIQLVPYGWSHPNPPVVEDAAWPVLHHPTGTLEHLVDAPARLLLRSEVVVGGAHAGP